MTSNGILLACRNPVGAHWQIGPLPPPAGQMLLIGWHNPASQIEGGVPQIVAEVLARALTSVGKVSFPIASSYQVGTGKERTNEDVLLFVDSGICERIVAPLKSEPVSITLVSTLRPQTVMRLFDDESFPWHLQGQVALLTSIESSPPQMERKTLLALFANDWASRAAELATRGVAAVLRPGVDGDVIGLLAMTPDVEQKVLRAMEQAATSAGLDWLQLSEDEFMSTLAAM